MKKIFILAFIITYVFNYTVFANEIVIGSDGNLYNSDAVPSGITTTKIENSPETQAIMDARDKNNANEQAASDARIKEQQEKDAAADAADKKAQEEAGLGVPVNDKTVQEDKNKTEVNTEPETSINNSSSEGSTDPVLQKACAKYKDKTDQTYKDYCSNIASCEIYNPTKDGEGLIKIQTIPFTPVIITGSTAGIGTDPFGESYKTYLQSIEQNIPNIGVKPFEQAKVVYTETQNAIYNCATLIVKLKVGESLLQLVKNNDTTNITQKIKSQNNTIKKELQEKKCNTPGNKDASYKDILVNNISYHYCNYRFYLNYLTYFPSDNVSKTTISDKVQKPGQDKYNTAHAVTNLKKQSNLVETEIRHVKQVYNLSFTAFSELENTYGLHILLLLIYDDYVQIRKNFSKILNPISQLAYKIPQAQCQSGCK